MDWRLVIGDPLAAGVLALVVFGLALGVERFAASEAAQAGEERR